MMLRDLFSLVFFADELFHCSLLYSLILNQSRWFWLMSRIQDFAIK